MLSAALALVSSAGAAVANPLGGQVVGGQATIVTSAPNTLTIDQTTPRAAIDWQSFNIAPNETTQFVQPSASAIALNRVQAGDPSVIAGKLTANGQLVLINPNGVVFTKGAQVDVNSLLATPTGISTANFMAGRMVFDQPGNPNAQVINNGHITVAQAGLAALVAPGVANNGVIAAKLGRVVLGGAATYTLDFYGDGLIQFDVGAPVSAAPVGRDGRPATSLVSNAGRIDAPGGTVLLTADAVSGILQHVVDATGAINAPTYAQTPGNVTIDAGAGNTAQLSGKINLSGLRPGQTGGTATVTGGSVALASTAKIDARGAAGGGTVAIGGGAPGPASLTNAAQTATVSAGAVIDASATKSGNGGAVAVLSGTTTVFDGTIRANGGPQGGNGGTIETSGTGQLEVGAAASVSATAPMGKPGTWLLDPDSDILITNSGGESVTCTTGSCTPNGDSSILYAATIEAALNAGTSVTVTTSNSGGTQQGNITVGQTAGGTDGAIALGAAQTVSLSLLAGAGGGAGSITINSPITDAGSGGGALSLVLSAPQGGIAVNNAITVAGSLTANAGAGSIAVSAPIAITAGGAVSLDYSGSLSFTPTLGSLQFTGGSGAGATLAINGAGYTLLYDLGNDATGLQSIDGTNDAGNYALAVPLTATGTYPAPLAGQANPFTGNFNGLGNTIANLTINDNTDGFVGLFGQLGSGGAIGNIGLVGGAVNGGGFASIGALLGLNQGTISDAYATDTVSGGQFANVGGLAGQNAGTISNSFATGSVSSNGNNFTGGLVGWNNGGTITDAYATGAVSGTQGYVGGLVGFNINSTITDAYATGAVNGGGSAVIGGLVGQNNGSAITDAYATGALSTGSIVGGLVGQTTNSATVTDGYYDIDTTGVATDGSYPNPATGMTTAALQAALPTFANGVWSIVAGVSYPYLTSFYPTAPQVISGIAYQDAGVTPLASTSAGAAYVSAQVAGTSLGSITTGANGYYYFLEPAGTIAGGGSAVIAYTTANGTTGAANGAAVANATGSLTGFNIWGNYLIAPTSQTTYSGVLSDILTYGGLQNTPENVTLIASAVGSNTALGTLVAGLTNYGYLATGASFTIDQTIDQNAGLYIATSASGAPITVAQPVEIDGANGLTLNAAGDLDITAPIAITAGGAVALTSGGNLNFTMGQGSLQFTGGSTTGASLAINGAGYTLLYDLGNDATGLQSIDGTNDAGNYALAVPLTATGTYTAPLAGQTNPFTGNFNGLGNTIANLTINDTTDTFVGLFGVANTGAVIANTGLLGGAVTSGDFSSVGALVGSNGGTISNVYATGAVTGGGFTYIGGLVGWNNNGRITNVYATGAVNGGGSDTIGGLVGLNGGAITDAYATGAVNGGSGGDVGGLVGNNGGTITNVYAVGVVTGTSAYALVGGNTSSTVTNGYWDTTTNPSISGINGINGVNGVSITGGGGQTTAGLASMSTLTALNGNGIVWGNFNNLTTPYLLSNPGPVFLGADTSATPLAYNLVFTAAQLEAINSNLSSNFLLAQPLDLSSVANWTPLAEGTPYTGTFNGFGNAITGLTINDSTDTYVGLFGQLSTGGKIENVSLAGTMTASANNAQTGGLVGFNNGGTISNVTSTATVSDNGAMIGGLVGVNNGAIQNASAIGAVTGGLDDIVGGLVGENQSGGSIMMSFATGAVTGGQGSQLGGLVGVNDLGGTISLSFAAGPVSTIAGLGPQLGGLVGTNAGSISDSYAVGSVTGSDSSSIAGGLVGVNTGGITNAYATGAVTGGTVGGGGAAGGLTGTSTVTVTAGFYDAGTTGQASGPQSDGSVGLATGDLQGATLPSGFSASNWGIVAGASYPYLCWEVGSCANTPQVVAGTVFVDNGQTPAGSGIVVAGLVDGTALGSIQTGGAIFTGANGYYYYLLAPNTISAGGNVLTLAQNYNGGATSGATLADQVSGSVSGLDIYANTLHEITSQVFNSMVQADLLTAAGTDTTPISVTAIGLIGDLVAGGNLQIDASGGLFVVDTPISFPGSVTLNSNGGIVESSSSAVITAQSLAINAADSVDLPQANLVGTLAANVTGAGSSFDFLNGQTLRIGTVGTLSGVTTNGTDGSEANIVLETTGVGSNIDINELVSTNGANGIVLGESLGEIGLSSAGRITINSSGSDGGLIAFAVEAIAANTINLEGLNSPAFNRIGANDDFTLTAAIPGTIAAQVTGLGKSLTIVDVNASLVVGQVSDGNNIGVAAESLQLPLVSGVFSNGGAITLVSEQLGGGAPTTLTLNLPVNANNGSSVLGTSPGLVELVTSDGGDITQSASGIITAGSLYAQSDTGNVILTAANHIGARDNGSGIALIPGRIAGFSGGDFAFRNDSAGIQVGTVAGVPGIFSGILFAGDIQLQTTTAGGITVNQPLDAGNAIEIAVAPGYQFTNNAANSAAFLNYYDGIGFSLSSTAGLDTSFANAPVVILADQMSLSGGTINAGFGGVLLGPASISGVNVALGAASSVGTLGLQQADLATITAGALQIGYRNPNGTVSFSGNIDVAGNIQLDTDNLPTLLLVTGGAVTESGGGIGFTGATPLQLGVLAGSATMNQDNAVGTLAAFTDGATSSFSFVNDNQSLTIDTLGFGQAGIHINHNGFPIAVDMTGLPNPLFGITTANGNVAVTVAGSGTLTINQAINAGDASIDATAAGNLEIASTGSITGGAIALVAAGTISEDTGAAMTGDSLVATTLLTGGADISLVQPGNAITGTVTLSALDATGTALQPGTIQFTDSTGFTIAGNGAAQPGIATDQTGIVYLASGGPILEQAGAAISTGSVTITSTGPAILDQNNNVQGLLGFTNTGASGDLVFNTVTNSPTGFGIGNSGVANPVGNVTLSTQIGDFALAAPVSASGTVSLIAGGRIFEPMIFGGSTPGIITANTLVVTAGGSVDLPGANQVGNLTATVTGNGSSFDFRNDSLTLTVGVGGGGGITTLNGSIVLETTTSGDIVIDQPINTIGGGIDVTASSSQIGLSSAGAITSGPGGQLVAAAAEAIAANGISLNAANLVSTFAGLVTGSAQPLSFNNQDLSLTIDSVQANTVGSLSLPSQSGVATNGGNITLSVTQVNAATPITLTLNQPVNANNFAGGGPSTVLGSSPGTVVLESFSGGSITQASTGIILGGALSAVSDDGDVSLTAANRIGANDNGSGIAATAGLLSGFSGGNFIFRNDSAGIQVDTVSGNPGIFSGDFSVVGNFFGDIRLLTTTAGNITINQPLNSGNAIDIAVAPGYRFINNTPDNNVFGITSAGLDTTYAGAPIVILADRMSLAGGTINAGSGPVVLGPASTSGVNIALGEASSSGTLGLQQADLDTITGGLLQLGYRNPDGTVSFAGTIDVAGSVQLNTANLPVLLLVTGGAVTESGGAISYAGATPLQLGVIAGSAAMTQNNAVGTLAAYTDGASPNVSFVNDNQSLTIGALSSSQWAVQSDGSGFPISSVMAGLPANPLAGITTGNGAVALTVANSGGLTISQPIDAGTGPVTVASAGDLTIGANGSVAGGAVTLATLADFTNDAGSGAITAGAGSQWLIYSTNPANDNDGGLTPAFIQYAATYPIGTSGTPTTPDASGNGLLYSVAPQITVTGVTKIYDGTTTLPTSTTAYTSSAGFNGDSVTLDTSAVRGSYAGANANSGIDVTLNGLTLSATNGGIPIYGYGIVVANGGTIGTITPASLAATIIGNPTKIYDGTTTASLASANYSLSGFVSGEGASVTEISGAYATANAGNGIALTASLGISNFAADSGTSLSNYTLPTSASGTGAITPATLSAGLTGTVGKVYDGTNAATLVAANYTLSGIIGGDSVSLNDPTTGSYASKNVGAGIGVSVSGLALSGAAAGNYMLANSSANAGIGTITPATLTAGLTGTVGKIYDGTTAATLAVGNYALSGIIGGDNVSLNDPTTGSYASKNVGTGIAVSVTGLALSGAAAGNYTLASSAANASIGTITPATLTAGLTGTVSKVFDGTTVATLVPANYTLTGVVSADSVSLNDPTTGSYASKNVGTGIGVSVTGLALSGAAAGNYTLASASASSDIGVITALPPPRPSPRPQPLIAALLALLSQPPQPITEYKWPIVLSFLFQPDHPLIVYP